MSRRLGQSGDGAATNRKTIALGITVVMVAVVALSIPVGYVMAGSMGATGTQGQAGDGGLQAGAQGNYSVSQGENCTEVVPVASNESVKDFYDYRTPFATNEYTNQTGESYSSEGTTDLQEPNTSVLFLYEGPTGNLSLVGVHGALNETSTGGSVSFDVTGLPEDGTWAVKDDEYDHESSVDNWSHEDGNASIDWTWGAARTDGFAFEGLGEEFDVTVDPAFNESATLFGEQYNGTVENWTVVSNASEDQDGLGDATTDNRTALNMGKNVSVTSGSCDALSSAAPTPPGDGDDPTPEERDEPVGGGAEIPDDTDDGDDADDPNQEDVETEEPDDDTDDTDDADGDGTEDDEADDDTQELDSIDLEIDWETIGPGETIPVTVTADYGDSTEDVSDEAEITSSDGSVATVDGAIIEGVSPGDVDITATVEGESDSESISVEDDEPDSELEGLEVVLGTNELAPGGSTDVTVEADTQVNLDPEDVTGEAEISSDNSNVASVAGSTVQANGEGEATISAEYLDGSASATITVTAEDGDDGAGNDTDADGVEEGTDNGTDTDGGDGEANNGTDTGAGDGEANNGTDAGVGNGEADNGTGTGTEGNSTDNSTNTGTSDGDTDGNTVGGTSDEGSAAGDSTDGADQEDEEDEPGVEGVGEDENGDGNGADTGGNGNDEQEEDGGDDDDDDEEDSFWDELFG